MLNALKSLRDRPGIAGAEADVIERSIVEIEATLAQLPDLLHHQCELKRLTPSSGEIPGQPPC